MVERQTPEREVGGLILTPVAVLYEGQSEITEPYLIIFKSSKIGSFLDDILLKLYVIYSIT